MAGEVRPTPNGYLEDEMAQVRMLLDARRFDEAEGVCRRLLTRNPDYGPLHAALGDIHLARGQWNQAVSCYEDALDLTFDPNVMERLAAARGNAIREGTASDQAPEVRVPQPRGREEVRSSRPSGRVVGAVIAGLVLVSVVVFLLARGAGSARRDASVASAERGAQFDEDIYDDTTPATPGPGGATVTQTPTTPASPPGAPSAGTVASMAAASGGAGLVSQVNETGPSAGAPRSGGVAAPTETLERQPALFSSRERELMGQLKVSRQRPPIPVRVASIALDDYSGLGILTVNAAPRADLNSLEADLLYAAYYSALTAFRTESALNTLVIRCVSRVTSPAGKEQDLMIFRATATRALLEPWANSLKRPTTAQLRNDILQEIWWDARTIAAYAEAQRQKAKDQPAQGRQAKP